MAVCSSGGSVAVGSGVSVAVGCGVSVGGMAMTTRSPSMVGWMTITPGVPSRGGVTTTSGSSASGVGVNVGASWRVGTGVGVGGTSNSEKAQPTVVASKNSAAAKPARRALQPEL